MIIRLSIPTKRLINSADAWRRHSLVNVKLRTVLANCHDEFENPSSPQHVIVFRWPTTLNLVSVGISKHRREDLTADAMKTGPESDPNLQISIGCEHRVV